MKTSNKILAAVLIVIVGCTIGNSIALRHKFLTTDFSNPYHDCVKIPIPPIEAVHITDSADECYMNKIVLIRGDQSQIFVKDTSLVSYTILDNELYFIVKKDYLGEVFIMLPKLKKVEAKSETAISILDFKSDSLNIFAKESGSSLRLKACTVSNLQINCKSAIVAIDTNNVISNLALRLQSESYFLSHNVEYDTVTTSVDKSSSVTLSGKSINMLREK